MKFKGIIKEKVEKAINERLMELEKANTELMKQKIDEFAKKARIWIKQEIKEEIDKREEK